MDLGWFKGRNGCTRRRRENDALVCAGHQAAPRSNRSAGKGAARDEDARHDREPQEARRSSRLETPQFEQQALLSSRLRLVRLGGTEEADNPGVETWIVRQPDRLVVTLHGSWPARCAFRYFAASRMKSFRA